MSYNLLKGKRGVIFGALNDMSIAWKVAEKAVEEVMFHPIRYCSHSLEPGLHPLIISKIPVVIYRKMLYTYNKKNMFNRKEV